jgi:hypothetical protein
MHDKTRGTSLKGHINTDIMPERSRDRYHATGYLEAYKNRADFIKTNSS